MKLTAIAASLVLALSFASGMNAANAHPHVWVTAQTEVMLGPNHEITGFRHHWTFDEVYSEMAVDGLDTNGDGVLSEEELAPLAKVNIDALKEFEYFTYATVGETKIAMGEPTEYRLERKDKILILHFTLPLAKPVPAKDVKKFSFAVYDPGLYVALTYEGKTPVTIASAKPSGCAAKMGDKPKSEETTFAQASAQSQAQDFKPPANAGAQFAEPITIQCKH